jgi:hypothetical protein
MPETNLNQLTKQIEDIGKSVNSLSSALSSHRHDGFTPRVSFQDLLFRQLSQSMTFTTLADDAELEVVETYGIGLVMAGTVDEAALFKFSTDGSVTLISNTTNVASTDTDGNLCVYDGGTKVKIKNRLGSSKDIRYIIFS